MWCFSQFWAAVRFRSIRSACLILAGLCVIALSSQAAVFADDKDLEEMQKKLNQGVMEKPFSVEDTAKIDAYIKDAMQKDLKPKQEQPQTWRPGYTCANLHNYYEYRDCMYYYRYYGHYW